MRYIVHFEYGNSGNWNTDVDQPADAENMAEVTKLATEWLNNPTASSRTRVRVYDRRDGRMVKQYTN